MGQTFEQLLVEYFNEMDEKSALEAVRDVVEDVADSMARDGRYDSEVSIDKAMIVVEVVFRYGRYEDPGDTGDTRIVEITPQRKWFDMFKRKGRARFGYYWIDGDGSVSDSGRVVASVSDDVEEFFEDILIISGM